MSQDMAPNKVSKSRRSLLNGGRFPQEDSDPLSGFANIMDVMLVFALGLMVALVAQSQELREHFTIQPVEVNAGKELVDIPDSMKVQGATGQGMESVGTVYRDSKTGKLILVGQ